MSEHRSHAAVNMLAQMLVGLSTTAEVRGRLSEDEPDYSLDEIVTEGTKVSAKVFMPTGDVYEVSVAWNAEESP